VLCTNPYCAYKKRQSIGLTLIRRHFFFLWYWGLNSRLCACEAWATLPAIFALVMLDIDSYFLPRLVWSVILLFFLSFLPSLGWQGMCHHAELFSIEMESCQLFLPWLAWSCNPPNPSLPGSLKWQVHTNGQLTGCNEVSLTFALADFEESQPSK
jgi:hypothetical protein